jgi:hypothetical protein
VIKTADPAIGARAVELGAARSAAVPLRPALPDAEREKIALFCNVLTSR